MNKDAILNCLRQKAAQGIPIIGAGAGTGVSARAEAAAGADLIIVYATGQFRMAGRSSMAGRFASGNANGSVLRLVDEIRPVAGDTPLLAGVFVQDPFCDIDALLGHLEAAGCCGVQNIPGMGGQAAMEGERTVSVLEALDLGFSLEAEFVRRASRRGLLTTPYCSRPEHIEEMALAGADIFVLHMGLTGRAEDVSMAVPPLEQCAETISRLAETARKLKPDAILLAHGGPIVEPADLAWLMARCPALNGFYGASSFERVPVEAGLRSAVRQFKQLSLKRNERSDADGAN